MSRWFSALLLVFLALSLVAPTRADAETSAPEEMLAYVNVNVEGNYGCPNSKPCGSVYIRYIPSGRSVKIEGTGYYAHNGTAAVLPNFVWSNDGHLAWWSGNAGSDVTDMGNLNVWDGHTVVQLSSTMLRYSNATWLSNDRLAWSEFPYPIPSRIRLWDGKITRTLGSGVAPVSSSDGRLAWRNHDGIVVWNGETSTLLDLVPYQSDPVWSLDGRLAWILYFSDGDGFPSTTRYSYVIRVWDGKATRTLGPFAGRGFWPIWSSDGRLAWVSSVDDQHDTINIWDGNAILRLNQLLNVRFLVWSLDGRLAWQTNNGIFVSDGRSILNVSHGVYGDGWPAWSGSGRLAWNSSCDIYIWDGAAASKVPNDGGCNSYPAWSNGPQLQWITR